MSSWRSPSASPTRMPVSYSTANSNRSRSRPQASRIAWTSAAVRIRGSFAAAFSVMRAPRLRLALADVVQERLPARPAARPGCQVGQQLAHIHPVAAPGSA